GFGMGCMATVSGLGAQTLDPGIGIGFPAVIAEQPVGLVDNCLGHPLALAAGVSAGKQEADDAFVAVRPGAGGFVVIRWRHAPGAENPHAVLAGFFYPDLG